jgi:hypothetical protein
MATKRSPGRASYPELAQVRLPAGTKRRIVAAAKRMQIKPSEYHRKVVLDHLDAIPTKET